MHDFLTVTLNPTLDVATSIDRLIDREKLRCDQEIEQVGGGGINVAQVLHSLGANCLALLTAGGYRGQEITQQLLLDKLPNLVVDIEPASRQCFTVYERETGREYRFILPGPALTNSDIDNIYTRIMSNLPSKWLVLSGNLPPGAPDSFYAQVIQGARAQRPDLKFLVDVAGPPLKHALDARIDVVKPSLTEFEWLTGQTFKDNAECVTAARHFVSSGQTRMVALSLGAKGAVVVDSNKALAANALPVEVTSTVGAGDSFAAGFIWAISQDQPLDQALCMASATAASALQTQGKLQFEVNKILADSQQVSIQRLL